MRARLFSRVGETKGTDFEIGSGATLGRHPQNEIVLEPSLISSRHARITYDPEGGCYVLEDLGSLNGTDLDGQRVAGSEPLGHLHVITFAGEHDFIFQDLERCAERHGAGPGRPGRRTAAAAGVDDRPAEEKTSIERLPVALPDLLAGSGEPEGAAALLERDPEERTMAERLPVALPGFLAGEPPPAESPPEVESPPAEVLDLMAGGARKTTFVLEVANPEGGVERVELGDGENLVGRGGDARIQPDNLDISRRHAMLSVAGGKVMVRDLGSRNHTFLDGEEIDGEVEVEPGSRLHFGSVGARLVVSED